MMSCSFGWSNAKKYFIEFLLMMFGVCKILINLKLRDPKLRKIEYEQGHYISLL